MSGHVEHGPREVLVLVVTCPRCGLDAGTFDPHDTRPLAVALAAMQASHACPPPIDLTSSTPERTP